MTKALRFRVAILVLVFFLGALGSQAQTTPPRVFFSDLQSGPNTGGQNSQGVFLTIWGTGFGAAQGASTVTVGGGLVNNCPVWGATWLWYQKITCQIGSSAATGNIVVTVGGQASTCENIDVGCGFTVRSGNIYFVSTSGNDSSGTGSFTTPWRTLTKCKSSMAAGDTCYAMNGIAQTSQDNYNACFAVTSAGAAGRPIALVAYPGASVTIGSTSCQYAMRTPSISGGPFANWTISQINFAGLSNQSLDLTSTNNWRLIGNDMTCPNTPGGQSACWETSATASSIYAFGNHLHSFPSNDKQYHGFYFSDNVNHVWVGWNSIHDGGCRGIQFHSTGNPNLYDLHVHDNLIYNIRCDAINMATIDPSKGAVEVYNNVIFHAGTGPDYTTQGPSSYTCIASPGITNSGSQGTGTAYFYSNTLYDCSSRSTGGGSTTQGAISVIGGSPSVAVQNNIVVTKSGDSGGYLTPDSSTSLVSGANNLCFGSGSCPGSFGLASIALDPQFTNVAGSDFHIATSSPAIGAGTTSKTSAYDHDGLIRSSLPSIGAYEFSSGTVVQRPNPPTSLAVVVN